ncbi:MAG TPA: class II fumarate hydratase [Oligoflexia bacterium]|nr:class II fumarate hydratase [Oligoflexia bacterium]HMR23983.1 class II fumarate hydratase [Oligoflexia bacterium]
MSKNTEYRIEKDSMGEMQVPQNAYYAAQTQRAVLNFPISGYVLPRVMIQALGEIKRAAALANAELNCISSEQANAIVEAAEQVIAGQFDDQFVVDIFQTGSGTSSNMNTNEVISNRATEILGGEKGSKLIHPNDHVNYGQSSNDVFPTAMHIATSLHFNKVLLPAMRSLHQALDEKAQAFDDIVKIGRTHLQDATPIRMGQVFSGYAFQVQEAIERIERALISISELALGGTAVGTGLNTKAEFPKKAIAQIAKHTQLQFSEARNHFAAQASKDAIVEASAVLKGFAVSFMKIANDIRLLGSGPRCGIGELILPETQPGSSIMPGKVNPVIAESVCMVCAQVIGNDAAVTMGGQAGNFELNVMMPMMIHNLIESSDLLAKSCHNFVERCVDGLKVNKERCESLIEESLAMCTSLAPLIGYDQAAAIAKEAYKTGKTVRKIALEKNVLDEEKLNEALDPRRMTERDL